MAGVIARNLYKRFSNTEALRGIELEVDVGELLVVLGPSGSGKSTLLRSIAGLEQPDEGEIWLGQDCVFSTERRRNLASRERNIGFVFQNYALYPHMSVYRNVAFGLKIRGEEKSVIDRRVRGALELVELSGLEDRMPRELSGGQQQRVAVARTLVTLPRIMLFDEPLSNLDPVLRSSMRTQLRELNRKTGITFIYVTHDSTEAMILGDRIAILDEGRVVDAAAPQQVYRFPRTATSASLTGSPRTNLIAGEVRSIDTAVYLLPRSDPYTFITLPRELASYHGEEVILHARPEDLGLRAELDDEAGRLRVLAVMPEGSTVHVHLLLEGERDHIVVRGAEQELLGLRPRQEVQLLVRRGNLYDVETGELRESFVSSPEASFVQQRETRTDRPAHVPHAESP